MGAEPLLGEKIVRLPGALSAEDTRHALGGALALARGDVITEFGGGLP